MFQGLVEAARMVAARPRLGLCGERKVRAPKGVVLDNVQRG
ncbi:MAG: hypothetical protein A4E69_01803 [Syntrophus sp. PtaB.Bin138]|nr:MAG: hypothetical protein A4E69_01803 [Syntrophus sp. PtaB.Bin138]